MTVRLIYAYNLVVLARKDLPCCCLEESWYVGLWRLLFYVEIILFPAVISVLLVYLAYRWLSKDRRKKTQPEDAVETAKRSEDEEKG